LSVLFDAVTKVKPYCDCDCNVLHISFAYNFYADQNTVSAVCHECCPHR